MEYWWDSETKELVRIETPQAVANCGGFLKWSLAVQVATQIGSFELISRELSNKKFRSYQSELQNRAGTR